MNIVGIVNFVTFLERTGAYRRALREAEYGSLERDRAFLESISPIRKIERIACPLMVIHGANDPRVPVSEAEQVVERAARARRARRVPALRGRGPRHHAPAEPPRLLPARGGVPAASTCWMPSADLQRCRACFSRRIWRPRAPASPMPSCARRCGAATSSTRRSAAPSGSSASRCSAPARSSCAAPPTPSARCRPGTRGVVAVSSGNHAQAVAYAGRAAGLPVTVVMNADANPRQARGDARLRRDDRLRGRRSDQPRADRARPRRARGARVRAPVRRLERDRRAGHGDARAARGGARPGRRDHAGRRRRAALGRGARLPARLAGDPRLRRRAGGLARRAALARRRPPRAPRLRADDDRRRRAHGADRRAHVRRAERAVRGHLARRRRRGAHARWRSSGERRSS